VDDQLRNKLKYVRRRIKAGRPLSDDQRRIAIENGVKFPDAEPGVGSDTRHENQDSPAVGSPTAQDEPGSGQVVQPSGPPPISVDPPAVGPPAAEVVSKVVEVALSPERVAAMLAGLQKRMAATAREAGLVALPDAFWDEVWRPACEVLIRKHAPSIGEDAAMPVVLGSAGFNMAQAARAAFRKPPRISSGPPANGAQGDLATAPVSAPETASGPSSADLSDLMFRS